MSYHRGESHMGLANLTNPAMLPIRGPSVGPARPGSHINKTEVDR
jgi:hypothetical protein